MSKDYFKVEYPYTNIVRIRPKTTKLVSQQLRRAICLDPSVLATTSTLTPTTLANPSHNSRVSRVHPPSRATTQEMLFRATTQGIPHHKFTRKTQSCSSINRLAGDTCRQALPAPRLPGGCRVPPGVKCVKTRNLSCDRPAGHSLPPGADVSVTHYHCSVCLAESTSLPGTTHSSGPLSPPQPRKRHSCTTIAVAWRQVSRRQAVHQIWKFPDFCKTPFGLQTPNPRIIKFKTLRLRRLADGSTPLGPSSQNPENDKNPMRRLAAGNVPPGGFPSRTPKPAYTHESPGGDSSLARRFLEIFQKCRNS
ncbi:hypothetical protein DEO72_LG3g2356 [Vigna unguiculata]|uniref:Uncharacterized protein n=1 Tax=Vigna unguiculata TaxID=3917 RepID=A0A4D6LHJ3_VIGUN|nr:hypothetical protein DEO72_LG3g2356 [Vigna unguiculata]